MSNYQEAFLGRLLRLSPASRCHPLCLWLCPTLQYRWSPSCPSWGIRFGVRADREESLFFYTTGSGICAACGHRYLRPLPCAAGVLEMPQWFVVHDLRVTRQNLIVNRDDSLAHFLLWLLSNNHWSVFLVTLHFAHSQYL